MDAHHHGAIPDQPSLKNFKSATWKEFATQNSWNGLPAIFLPYVWIMRALHVFDPMRNLFLRTLRMPLLLHA